MSIIGKVCQRALEDYIDNPWIWLRESDLVADLVQRIKGELIAAGEALHVPAKINFPTNALLAKRKPEIFRVRTEVKFSFTQGNDRDKNDPQRTDICLLKSKSLLEGQESTVNIMGNGIRDATLLIDPKHAAELIEVKLAPHHYVKGSTTGWLSDLIKLADWEKCTGLTGSPMHLLSIDTGLPVENLFQQENEPEKKKKKIPWHLDCYWPLYAGKNYEITVPGKKIELLWCKNIEKPSLLFWALACRSEETSGNSISVRIDEIQEDGKNLRQNFDAKNQYRPLTNVTVGCWKVTVTDGPPTATHLVV